MPVPLGFTGYVNHDTILLTLPALSTHVHDWRFLTLCEYVQEMLLEVRHGDPDRSHKQSKTPHTSRRTAILLLVLLCAFVVAYFPVWKNLIMVWSSAGEYSHGFLVLPLAAYLVWRKKTRLLQTPVRASNWGLLMVLFSLALYLFAYFARVLTLQSCSLILVLAGMLVYLYGFPIGRELIFPLCMLFFHRPLSNQRFFFVDAAERPPSVRQTQDKRAISSDEIQACDPRRLTIPRSYAERTTFTPIS
jgi:hypothetical protein